MGRKEKKMKKKIMVITCALLLAAPILSFAKDKKEPKPPLSANEYAHDKASLKRSNDLDKNEAHKSARRAKKRADEKAETAQKKSDIGQSGTKGQINAQF